MALFNHFRVDQSQDGLEENVKYLELPEGGRGGEEQSVQGGGALKTRATQAGGQGGLPWHGDEMRNRARPQVYQGSCTETLSKYSQGSQKYFISI